MAGEAGKRLRVGIGIVTWALISAASIAAGYGVALVLAHAVGDTRLFSKSFLPFAVVILCILHFGGPITILIVGWRKRRVAMIAGPLLLIPVISGALIASQWIDFQRSSFRVAALDARTFLPAEQQHDLIFMEQSGGDCDPICQQILLRTNYRVGVASDPSPLIYRKISEAECQANGSDAVRFLGICAVREKVPPDTESALFVVTPRTWAVASAYHIRPGELAEALATNGTAGVLKQPLTTSLPEPPVFVGVWGFMAFDKLPVAKFSGKAFALVERNKNTEGQGRVLGRWISGGVAVWPFRSDPIGKNFSREQFYSAALGLPIE